MRKYTIIKNTIIKIFKKADKKTIIFSKANFKINNNNNYKIRTFTYINLIKFK